MLCSWWRLMGQRDQPWKHCRTTPRIQKESQAALIAIKTTTMLSQDEWSSPLSDIDHPHPISYTPLSNMPSPSPKQTPIPFVNSPLSMTQSKFLHNKKGSKQNLISISSNSHQTSVENTTHKEATTQTFPPQVSWSPLPFMSIPTIAIPQHTIRVKEPLNYARALELHDLICDVRLIAPMHAYCELHSLLLTLYRAYHTRSRTSPQIPHHTKGNQSQSCRSPPPSRSTLPPPLPQGPTSLNPQKPHLLHEVLSPQTPQGKLPLLPMCPLQDVPTKPRTK